jgi:adenine/guanine phosphoribosyltransferase-like PRPP-binding protein
MSDEKLLLSFREISKAMHHFSFPEIDFVIGIATGGIYPAIMAAHQLKVDFGFLHLHYRDQENKPLYEEPRFLSKSRINLNPFKRILLVDEVSVSGKTMDKALEMLKNHEVTTFVLKGKGDLVLFPDIRTCVIWPWKIGESG